MRRLRRDLVVGALCASFLLEGCARRITLTVLETADVEVPGPRLRVVAAPDGPEATVFVEALTERIGNCAHACDGSVELRSIAYEEEVQAWPEGDHWAVARLARVRFDLALLDAAGAEVEVLHDVGTLDRWTTHAATESSARARLVARDSAALDLAASAGIAVASRLQSGSWSFTRSYFVGGPLRYGAAALRDGDAESAAAQWRRVAQNAQSPPLVARVYHNLAVAYEWVGATTLARDHLNLALAAGASARTRRYADLLETSRGRSRPLRQF